MWFNYNLGLLFVGLINCITEDILSVYYDVVSIWGE